MNDEYLLDKKGSDSISKFYKVFYILFIIAFVFMGIGLLTLIVVGASMGTIAEIIQNYQSEITDAGIPYGFVEGFINLIREEHFMLIVIFQYVFVVGLYVYQFLYLRKAKKMQKHFTEENAKQLLTIGLVTIIYPIIISFIFGALYSNFSVHLAQFVADWEGVEYVGEVSNMTNISSWGNAGSLTIGLALILISLYVKHGSKVIENNNKFNQPIEE